MLPIPDKTIMVIIPVYNEGAVIRATVESLLKKMISVIVVDDGSAEPIAQKLIDLPVTIIRHRVNLGQGAALQTGFNYALKKGASIVITFDADGQHTAADIEQLIAPILNNEADIVLGSRFLPGANTPVPLIRKILLQIACYINYLFSGLLLSDAHNGLRAFNIKALEKITITENRMAHASEILFELKKHRLVFKEIPVQIMYTSYSRQKGQNIGDSIKVLFDLVLHKLFK
jgi:polyprenyl-phospho-N-acetylgalactosaminyl synthase